MSQHDLDLKKILWLSRLNATPEEQEKLSSSLIQIIDWIGIMKEVDTSNVLPMTGSNLEMPRRDDVIADGGIQDKVLANAPDKAFGMFGVNKVVE